MDQESFGNSSKLYTNASQSPRRSKIKIIVIFLVLALLIGFVATRFLGSSEEKQEETPTPTPTEFMLPTDTPTPPEDKEETTPTPKEEPTPTPRPASNPVDKSSGLDRSKINVSILNGSGTAGVAGKASELLKGFGYNVGSTGNADNFDYVNVSIQVKNESSKYVSLLKKDLEAQYTIGSTSATLSASSSADAVVIIGK